MAITKIDIKNQLLTKAKALGNSDRGFKEVCSDLINQFGTDSKSLQQIAQGSFLSVDTIKRMSRLTESECGQPYRPNADTVERILRYFGSEVRFDQVVIRSRYANKPKEDSE